MKLMGLCHRTESFSYVKDNIEKKGNAPGSLTELARDIWEQLEQLGACSVSGLECPWSSHITLTCQPHKSGGTCIRQLDGNCKKNLLVIHLYNLGCI